MHEIYARNSRARSRDAIARGDFCAAANYRTAAALFLAGNEDLAIRFYRAARGY